MLEMRRQNTEETIGVLGPIKLLGLDIEPESNPEWTEKEISNLNREGLFDTPNVRNRRPLQKLPFRFYYRYTDADREHRHYITDWEAGALYWKCQQNYGERWENYFRQKLEEEFSKKDLLLVMGTVHRFPDQWLIISLIYPPKGALETPQQISWLND
jgi:hypothetical protein